MMRRAERVMQGRAENHTLSSRPENKPNSSADIKKRTKEHGRTKDKGFSRHKSTSERSVAPANSESA
ncbi:MAG: hypothetical protein IKC72_05060 [Clostridia bacterium]|nr:hypothetical protein [Clostridia bacterium]